MIRFLSVLGSASLAVATVALGVDAPVSYKLQQAQGRTVIVSAAGEGIPWACYSLGIDQGFDEWKAKHPDLIKAGVHLYQLSLWDTKKQMFANPWTSLDGQPVREPSETSTWRRMAPELLALDPQARFLMRFTILPDPDWRKAHLDQYAKIKSHGGGMLRDGYSINPSQASVEYGKLAVQNIRDAVA